MPVLLWVLTAGIVVFGCVILLLARAKQRLEHELKDREQIVTKDSKLLIEKNLELYDQNVAQQRELRDMDDFLAIASHQMRTPATEIKWALGALLEEKTGDERARKDVRQAYESAKRMEQLIESLLEFVRMGQSHARGAPSPFDPNPLIEKAGRRIQTDFKRADIELSFDLQFKGSLQALDDAALEMVASNLIENAFHYTPETGKIRISTARTSSGSFDLEVQDSGIGIPEEMRERLFVKFRRSQSAQKLNTTGSGLGLYIVKKIVERAGGDVTYRPAEGGGSIFVVTLPALA